MNSEIFYDLIKILDKNIPKKIRKKIIHKWKYQFSFQKFLIIHLPIKA
jgi:hypothetical protein